MIESVLNLGIKGADLVISQLEKIQENKEKFSKPIGLSVSSSQTPGTGPQGNKNQQQAPKADTILKSILDVLKKQREVLVKGVEANQKTKPPEKPKSDKDKEKEEKKEETKGKDALKETGKHLNNVVQGLATLSGGNTIRAIAGAAGPLPFIGAGITAGGNAIVTALESFRNNIESASKIHYDTAESKSRIENLISGSKGENFTGRTDIDLNSQRALAETLADKYGVVQKPLQEAIKELYSAKNAKVDVNLAQQLAAGNYNALGTDKGFFFQKISDQLSGLPPTMRQAIQASLLKNVTEEDKFIETSEVAAARQAVTRFDTEQRDRARELMKPVGGVSPVENAITITHGLNTLDTSLNKGFDKLLDQLKEVLSNIPGLSISGQTNGRRTPLP